MLFRSGARDKKSTGSRQAQGMYSDVQSAVCNVCHIGFTMRWKKNKEERTKSSVILQTVESHDFRSLTTALFPLLYGWVSVVVGSWPENTFL